MDDYNKPLLTPSEKSGAWFVVTMVIMITVIVLICSEMAHSMYPPQTGYDHIQIDDTGVSPEKRIR